MLLGWRLLLAMLLLLWRRRGWLLQQRRLGWLLQWRRLGWLLLGLLLSWLLLVRLLSWWLLLGPRRAGDSCNNCLGHRAGPEVVVAVSWGRGAAQAGLLKVETRSRRESIIHQAPEGLLALILPASVPHAVEERQQLIHWALSCIKG